ncbi:unnamed protein product [Penicillium viridicatum]
MAPSTTDPMSIGSVLNPDHAHTVTPQHMASTFVSDPRLGSQLPNQLAALVEQRTIPSFAPDTWPGPQLPTELSASYTNEEVCFLWVHRIFFEKQWDGTLESFNKRFPKRHIGNIQNKVYRQIKDNNFPSRNEVFLSFINRKGLKYPWMLEAFQPQAKFHFKSELPAALAGRCCHIPSTSAEQIDPISIRLGYSNEELDFIWEEGGTSGHDWNIIFDKFKQRFPDQKCSSRDELCQEYHRLLTLDLQGLDQPSGSYTDEENWFIWFHRVFLEKQWDGVLKSFNERFPERKPDTITRIQNNFCQKIKSDTIPCRCEVFLSFIELKNPHYPWLLEVFKQGRAGFSPT